MKPAGTHGHDDKRGEVLERIQREYGKPEEKQREANKKLGKDEFFKIMVTQIQHQDPLKPYQNEQMAAQMAQFTALEQMINVNTNLEKLTQAQVPLQNMGAANLIGKFVTADSSRVVHTEGKSTSLAFELPTDSAKLRVVLINDRGENVREIEMANQKKGPVTVQWDGKKENNMPAASGQYLMQISALNENGKAVPVQTQKTEMVHGIAFEGKETVLLTGAIEKPQKMLLRNVSKIVDPNDARKAVAAAPGLAAGSNSGMSDANIAAIQELINKDGLQLNEEVQGGISPAMAGKYSPMNPEAFKGAGQRPDIAPERQLSPAEIAARLEDGPDLSAANPVAAAMREGTALPSSPAQAAAPSPNDMSGANPVAAAVAAAANAAAGQALPSGDEGSTAGKWSE